VLLPNVVSIDGLLSGWLQAAKRRLEVMKRYERWTDMISERSAPEEEV
jgi:hypothetical protein